MKVNCKPELRATESSLLHGLQIKTFYIEKENESLSLISTNSNRVKSAAPTKAAHTALALNSCYLAVFAS